MPKYSISIGKAKRLPKQNSKLCYQVHVLGSNFVSHLNSRTTKPTLLGRHLDGTRSSTLVNEPLLDLVDISASKFGRLFIIV